MFEIDKMLCFPEFRTFVACNPELTMARVSGNAEVLSAALETARACGVDSSLLEAAQNDLAALA
eukprot:6297089-Amphidinium_carterae.1